MTSFFFQFLGCNNPQKENNPHKNQVYSHKILQNKTQKTQKLVYSFKKRKYVKKYQNLHHSLKNINQNIETFQNNKEMTFYKQKDNNRFLISQQFSYTINPCSSKLKKSMSTNSSSMVGLSLYLSRQNSFQKDILRSTQKTQLCGAQSTVDESKGDCQKIIWNNETRTYGKSKALMDLTNHSCISVTRNQILQVKQNENKFLLKDKSQGSLLTLGSGLKKHWSSTLQRDHSGFQQIQEEQQDRSPTLYQAQRQNYQSSVFQYKINQEPSMKKSLVLIKINGFKTKFDQMEIRSARSIKQSSSDEFSEVLGDSGLTLDKRKFSLAEKLFKEYL